MVTAGGGDGVDEKCELTGTNSCKESVGRMFLLFPVGSWSHESNHAFSSLQLSLDEPQSMLLPSVLLLFVLLLLLLLGWTVVSAAMAEPSTAAISSMTGSIRRPL